MEDPKITDTDRALGFTIPARHARGRVVRLGETLDRVLGAHAYPAPIEALLAEALTLAALLGSTLKDAGGQLTLQAQTDSGVVKLLVCDYKAGELRGYVQFDPVRLSRLGKNPSVYALFNKGHLAITFDQADTKERYQGIVPLDGDSIGAAAESYFLQSEQIPSLVRIGLGRDAEGKRIAGGIFLQHLPEGELGRERLHTRLDHPEWDNVAVLGGSVRDEELADPDLPLETLLWRLFNEEEVLTLPGVALSRGCRCDPAHVGRVIARFSSEDRASMMDADGLINVDCEFCARRFALDPDGLIQAPPAA